MFTIHSCRKLLVVAAASLLIHRATVADGPSASDLDQVKVAAVFQRYCTSCHNDVEAESGISLGGLDKVITARSTEDKQVIVAGRPDDSLLFQLISGKADPHMPPKEDPQPREADIELIRRWIAEGAKVMQEGQPAASSPSTTKPARDLALVASAIQIDAERVALGRVGQVDIVSSKDNRVVSTIGGILGKASSLRLSYDGKLLVIGSGRVGVEGQISIVDLSSMQVIRQLRGHNDLVYCAALSPDGQWLASGSYDRKVIVWKLDSTEPAVTVTGHNGPIYDLDFHPNSQMLATASGDQTIKLWRVPDGLRLDTLGQPEGEMRCVRFAADGRLLYGAGADKQVRQWLVDPSASSGSPLLLARFAHEREVLRMALDVDKLITASADGTIKLWTATDLQPLGEIATTKVLPVAVCMTHNSSPTIIDLKGSIQEIPAAKISMLMSPRGIDNSKAAKVSSRGRETSVPPFEVKDITKFAEFEPNNSLDQAVLLQLPVEINGTLEASNAESAARESDMYKFFARAGEDWAIEIFAASEKSPLDSLVDILDSRGMPVLQTRLQALRESYFTFRGKDSSTSDDFRLHKWQDMELDEYLYSGGEVTRLWLYPRGPDSGFKVYPGAEARHTFFGTTPISHPLGDPAYIVRSLAEDESPLPNGLPVFPIYYENDDDPLRERGSDSRLTFRAPADGQYTLRVRDARGFAGSDYRYRAVIRPLQPDFSLSFGKLDLAIPLDSGLEWSVKAKRSDGMDSAIAITLSGLPDGILATNPVIIEANQQTALGTIFVTSEVKPTAEPIEIRLSAKTIASAGLPSIEKQLTQQIKITINDTKVPRIVLLPQVTATDAADGASTELNEISIRPGQTISARLRVQRNGVEGGIGFGKEDSGRNLPHGAFVDNIGLNGLLIVEGQSERELFITAAPKLQSGRYQFHFRSEVKGNPTSKPLWLNVVPR